MANHLTVKAISPAADDAARPAIGPFHRAVKATQLLLGFRPGLRNARGLLRRAVFAIALAGAVAGATGFGYHYWTVGRYLENTDDAYVKADYSTIAPKVSGYIAQVTVGDNEHVTAGQLLATIDDRDFLTAVAQAKAEVESADAAIHNIDARLTLQQSVINQQKAAVAATEAALPLAEDDDARYRKLVKTRVVPVQRAQRAATTLLETRANLRRNQAELVAAYKKIDVLKTERGQAVAQRQRAAAALRQAELNLSYTRITAPVEGTVGARSLRVGQYVQAGTQLMAIVPLNAVYVVANFKESQLTHVRAGQRVTFTVDSFPGMKIKGRVDSLSPASGLEFALLPPDNATGNFTKIVQRIPVKIVFNDQAVKGLLRPGMSVETTIDTRPGQRRQFAKQVAPNAPALAATAPQNGRASAANDASM